jgi:uncharacterized protein YunC (DUF1805 family)
MNKILLCATDAGGARNLAPLLRVIKKQKLSTILITSKDLIYLFDLKNTELIDSKNVDFSKINDLLIEIKPIAIICGTTRYVAIDRLLIVAGRKKGINTVVVLDEWFNYRIRFLDEHGELVYLPDAITIMDKKAKEDAVKEGIPGHLCYITGSPSLAALTDRAEDFVKNPPNLPNFLQSNQSLPIFTFISETHAEDYGSKKGEHGPLGPYLGYTEHSVKNDILEIFKKINKPCVVVEKLHPSSKEEDLDFTYNKIIRWIRIKKTNLWSLFWHSEAIIGMRSMALLEAIIFNRPTISYQPDLLVEDKCTAVSLGLVKKLSTPSELEQWLRNQFDKPQDHKKRNINRYPFARKEASKKVVNLAIK